MSKGKPRHNPSKKQNQYGNWCDAVCSSETTCHALGFDCFKTCKGNPHNCVKTLYKRLASRSNTQINNGEFRYK